jgi:hypothetical protein
MCESGIKVSDNAVKIKNKSKIWDGKGQIWCNEGEVASVNFRSKTWHSTADYCRRRKKKKDYNVMVRWQTIPWKDDQHRKGIPPHTLYPQKKTHYICIGCRRLCASVGVLSQTMRFLHSFPVIGFLGTRGAGWTGSAGSSSTGEGGAVDSSPGAAGLSGIASSFSVSFVGGSFTICSPPAARHFSKGTGIPCL